MISIATMGKFIPAAGGGTRIVQVDSGSSGYGVYYHDKKPEIVINRVIVEDEPEIKLSVTLEE